MKICLIADGRDVHTQRWAEYFAGRHEVHLITYDAMGITLPGVTEHVLHSPSGNLYLSFWPYHLQVMRLIKAIRPDIVHAHFIAKYGFHLPFLGVRPTIVSALGDDVLILPRKSRIIRRFTGMALRSADRVYAVSKDIENHIIEDFGIAPGKIAYLPFGVETERFAPGPERDSSGVVFFSNRKFQPVYDIPTLIRGFSRAYEKNRGIRLILKGGGPDEPALRALVRELGLSGAVEFRPKTPYADVPVDLQQVDVFVTTAVSDGTPVSLLEAMSSGLACIATAVGGVPEWIADGKNGVLIHPRDPEMLADRMLMLAADAGIRRRLGAAARKTVIERGDWERLMATAESDYETLVKAARANRR